MCQCPCPKCSGCICNPAEVKENDQVKWFDPIKNEYLYGVVTTIHPADHQSGKTYRIMWADGTSDLYDDWDLTELDGDNKAIVKA